MQFLSTSIIDRPRLTGEKDLFGIDKYQEALVNFIKQTDTPITVAIQGEWGSGKTSLMNIMRSNLCDTPDAKYHGIWLNTWQHSLMRSPEETLIRIIAGLTQDVMSVINTQHPNKMTDVGKKITSGLKSLFKGIAKAGVNAVGNQIGVDSAGDMVDDMFSGSEKKEEGIAAIRAGLAEAVQKSLELENASNSSKRGFLFFIDDLDRIDPPVAVQILELLKNIFDIPNCVFLLSIDYDVVIKGLKPKFGELTPQNEREFRSFFDKIIQLPFTMPTASYQVNQFIADSVSRIAILTPEEQQNIEIINIISEMANLSVGTNPRALKRLMNTLSLIQILNSTTGKAQTQVSWEKQINFGLVCMQIAYPFIYGILNAEPDFKRWTPDLLKRHKVNALSTEDKEQLAQDELFDEEWEQILYQLCQKDIYLSNRVFLISTLLNRLAQLVPENANLGETIERILELSAVTSVDANDKPKSATPSNRGELKAGLWGRILPFILENKGDLANPAVYGENGDRAGTWIDFDRQNSGQVVANFSIIFLKNAVKVAINSPLILTPYKQKSFMEIVNNWLDSKGLREKFSQIAENNGFKPFDNGFVECKKDGTIGVYFSVERRFAMPEQMSEQENIENFGKMIAEYAIFRKDFIQKLSNIKNDLKEVGN